MTFEQLQEEVRAICQPIIDAYETIVEEFKQYAEDRTLLQAIASWTGDIAKAEGKASQARRWLDGLNEITADNFNADHCLQMIEEDYRFVVQLESSTNPVDNAVENYRTLGKQKFIRSTVWDTPLEKIEAAVRKYAIDRNIERDAEIFGLCVTGEEEAILAQSQPENGSERLQTPNTGTFDEGYDAGFQAALKEIRNV